MVSQGAMVSFDNLIVGQRYNRPFLARLWGYQTWSAIGRGVVTPRDQNIIILFITKEKQETLTQYEDHIDNDLLFWEGEKEHGNDLRIAAQRDSIHVFYRDRHHQDFTYMGRAVLGNHRLYKDRPSKFAFQLADLAQREIEMVAEPFVAYAPEFTERSAIVANRIGQGRFRDESIKIWQTCCVSGFTTEPILIASHIKPWRASDNRERLDGYNSLLLVPTYDKLFDKGYIGFDGDGRITISEKIDMADIHRTGLDENSRLVTVPERSMPYLEYHRRYVFDLVECAEASSKDG